MTEKRARAPHYQQGLPFRLGECCRDEVFTAAVEKLHGGDPDGGLKMLCIAAKRGEPGAALLLGRIRLATAGAEPEGVRWLSAAADAGELEALHLLGLAHARGHGVKRDLVRARRLQTEAAEHGLVDAQFELSLLLAQGSGGKRDTRGARRWEDKAADAGHARACLNRAARLARKKKPDFAAAMRWYERAVEGGSAEAAARLCRMYLAGQGATRNEATAEHWYKRAAELGHDWSKEKRK